MKKFLLFTFLLFLFNISYGQSKPPEGKFCNTREGRIEYIQDFSSKYFDWILQKVERVPPDIEKYLFEEYRDSLETKNESRFDKVVSNPYFYPWRLRDSIQKFQEKVKDGYGRQNMYGSTKKDPHESEILYYMYLLNGSSDVIEKFDEYRLFDRKRQKPYFNTNQDDYKRGFSRGIYMIVVNNLISCSFKK